MGVGANSRWDKWIRGNKSPEKLEQQVPDIVYKILDCINSIYYIKMSKYSVFDILFYNSFISKVNNVAYGPLVRPRLAVYKAQTAPRFAILYNVEFIL